MAAPKAVWKAMPAWRLALSKFCYNRSYYPQIGLMTHDCFNETPEVHEAIRRMPIDLQDARLHRITRAIHLSGKKIILPKEEWVAYEDDIPYLKPYLEEVKREFKERAEWNKM